MDTATTVMVAVTLVFPVALFMGLATVGAVMRLKQTKAAVLVAVVQLNILLD